MLPSLDIKGCDGACIHAVGFALGRSPALAGQLAQIVGAITSPQEIHLISLQSAHLRLDAHSVDPFAWDHVSGLPDFPGVPVWVTSKERESIRKSGDMDFCRLFNGIRYGEYGFEGGPYLGFPARHDVYEDGSIVVVPVFGHTPRSLIIFATLPSGTRYAVVGDIVWQLEGITQREERPWIIRRRADTDAEANRVNLLRMIAPKEHLPDLVIVPVHDMRAFAEMPRLSQPSSTTGPSH